MRRRHFMVFPTDAFIGYPSIVELRWREAYSTDAPLRREGCPPCYVRRDGQGGCHLSSHDVHILFNLTAHGFWQSERYKQKGPEERVRVIRELVEYMAAGNVRLVLRFHAPGWMR